MPLFKKKDKIDPIGPVSVRRSDSPQERPGLFSRLFRRGASSASATELEAVEDHDAPEEETTETKEGLTPQKAALLTFVVFAALTGGIWKGMEYGIDHVKREPLLGRGRAQQSAPPLEIGSLPLLRAAVVQPTDISAPGELSDSVNRIFDPATLLGGKTIDETLVEMGIKEPEPVPTPEEIAAAKAANEPSLLETYKAEIEAKYAVFAVAPGKGAFLNARWYAAGDLITRISHAGSLIPARLASVNEGGVLIAVEGETFPLKFQRTALKSP